MSEEMQKFTAALNSFVGAPRGSRRNPKVSTAVHGPIKFKMKVNNANYTVSVSPDGHAMAVLDSADWRDVSPKRVVVSSAMDALNKASAILAEVKEARKRAFDGGFYDRFGRMPSGTSEEFRRLYAEADVYEHLAYALNTRNQYIPANMNPQVRRNSGKVSYETIFSKYEALRSLSGLPGMSGKMIREKEAELWSKYGWTRDEFFEEARRRLNIKAPVKAPSEKLNDDCPSCRGSGYSGVHGDTCERCEGSGVDAFESCDACGKRVRASRMIWDGRDNLCSSCTTELRRNPRAMRFNPGDSLMDAVVPPNKPYKNSIWTQTSPNQWEVEFTEKFANTLNSPGMYIFRKSNGEFIADFIGYTVSPDTFVSQTFGEACGDAKMRFKWALKRAGKMRSNPRARLNTVRKHGNDFDTVSDFIDYERAIGRSAPAPLWNMMFPSEAEKKKKKKIQKLRSNPQARLNMAIRAYGHEFDTAAELAAYEKAIGVSPIKAPRAVSAAASAPAPRAPRLRGTPKEAELPTRRREWSGELREPEGKPGYEQAKMIGVSIGGIGSYCPDLAGVAVKGGAHVEALSRMGLTKAKASAVIDEMKRRGVVYGKTAQQQAVAREILATVGGVVCPSPVAAKNPAFWQRAY